MDTEKPVILRIKRKRDEEPLDALVVESGVRKKKSRGGLNVFQFAQTVEHDAWEDDQRRQALQEEISRLAKANTTSTDVPTPAPETKPPSPSIARTRSDTVNRQRYTIVQHEETPKARFPTSPPQVISHKDLQEKKKDFRMYDAILSGADGVSPPQFDPEMDKFMPMLTDYLKIHDMSPPASPAPSSSAAAASPTSPVPVAKAEDEDYVWDVFYQRPTKLSEWNAVANIGTLTGLPPSTTDPNDSDSDTEPEDEADEDSNDEEYYKNDYPEDEEASSDGSDMFHDGSDNEGLAMDEESFDDNDWR